MKKLLKMETVEAEKSFALRERAQAELDKVGREQKIRGSCRVSEAFFLSSAAVLRRASSLGPGGPGQDEAASSSGPGRQASPVHGEERGRPKAGEGEGGSARAVGGDGGQVRVAFFVLS